MQRPQEEEPVATATQAKGTSAPRNSRKVGTRRLYEWRAPDSTVGQEPERYWSVTTLIKSGVPSPALTYWGMREVASYAAVNHRVLAAMLEAVRVKKTPGGLAIVTDPDAVTGAIDWLKESPWRERNRKADIGTAVHAAVEAHILGVPWPEPEEGTEGHLAQFARFIEAFHPTFELAEASVYNRTAKYAGTLDFIATIPGRGRALIDTKTAGSGVYPEAALQLAAYRYAEFIGLPDGTEAPMPTVDGCAVLWLPGGDDTDGWALIPVVADEQVYRSFRHVIEVARWAEELSKSVIGQPLPIPSDPATAELFAPAELDAAPVLEGAIA
jgi:hypothetical protein